MGEGEHAKWLTVAGFGGFLYHVEPADPAALIAAAALLATVALIATLVPARRAPRLDPMEALRTD